jgi:hypothetical protein
MALLYLFLDISRLKNILARAFLKSFLDELLNLVILHIISSEGEVY